MDSIFPWSPYLVVLGFVTIVLGVVWFVLWSMRREDHEGAESLRRYLATGRILPPCSLCGSRKVSDVKDLPGRGVEFRCADCGMRSVDHYGGHDD